MRSVASRVTIRAYIRYAVHRPRSGLNVANRILGGVECPTKLGRRYYYHPQLQRFISKDPIGFAGGPHLYAYVENSPLLFTDPLGLTKGGKRNISVTHDGKELTKRTPAKEVQKALDEAVERGMSRAHIGKLRGLLKVIARGGAAGIIGVVLGELFDPAEAGAGSE